MAEQSAADAKSQLKQTIRNVVLGQGNRFIKELLRDNDLPIGATKADFLKNITQAIEDDILTGEMVEAWLQDTEGWGQQHIYVFKPRFVAASTFGNLLANSEYADLVNAPATHAFPDDLSLTTIGLSDQQLALTWHQRNDRWIRAPEKDDELIEDGDFFELRAYRQRSDRTVVRFEWLFGRPYCLAMLQLPHDGTTHADQLTKIWEPLVNAGLLEELPERQPLTNSVNKFTENQERFTASQRRMQAEGGYVDLVSLIPDKGFLSIAAIRQVDSAVDASQFKSAEGKFHLSADHHPNLSRPIKVDIYGSQSRMRIAAQCNRDDVYYISDLVWDFNQDG